jgi:transcriptional regulator with XRE-family HTH domain
MRYVLSIKPFNAQKIAQFMHSQAQSALPLSVRRSLRKLGQDISVARKRRRLTKEAVAQRAFIARNTLTKVEEGDPGVSIGIYATVLFVLGLVDGLADIADPLTDAVGLSLDADRLPERTRQTRRARS